ncbi:MAG: hypothetical protein ACE5OR_09150 [bacterium]
MREYHSISKIRHLSPKIKLFINLIQGTELRLRPTCLRQAGETNSNFGDEGGRPYYPYVFLGADHHSALIPHTHSVKPWQFLNLVENIKVLPHSVNWQFWDGALHQQERIRSISETFWAIPYEKVLAFEGRDLYITHAARRFWGWVEMFFETRKSSLLSTV